MATYLVTFLCDDGETAAVSVRVDESDPLYLQDAILVAIEMGHRPVEVTCVEYVEDET